MNIELPNNDHVQTDGALKDSLLRMRLQCAIKGSVSLILFHQKVEKTVSRPTRLVTQVVIGRVNHIEIKLAAPLPYPLKSEQLCMQIGREASHNTNG